jgi:glycerol-3-phosphate dehydrogenase (NAD(P)+)
VSEIAVVGAGAWGTSLSIVLGRKGTHRVRLWAHEKEVRDSISSRRVNELFLPEHTIPHCVSVAGSFEEAIDDAEIVVGVMPSQHCRGLFQKMRPFLRPGMLFVSATKGLEEGTLLRMTEVITVVVGSDGGFQPRIGALSGPTFAKEVARGDPTAITIASRDTGLAETIQREFGDPRFRVYTNTDVAGVELGGALKNIIAIAAGVCDGLGLGHNSIAALITRGLAEITRLVVACGGRQDTMAGLAGLGDLVLTCTGGLSRNRSVGVETRTQTSGNHRRHAWHGGRRRVHYSCGRRTRACARSGNAYHRADGCYPAPRQVASRCHPRPDDSEFQE